MPLTCKYASGSLSISSSIPRASQLILLAKPVGKSSVCRWLFARKLNVWIGEFLVQAEKPVNYEEDKHFIGSDGVVDIEALAIDKAEQTSCGIIGAP